MESMKQSTGITYPQKRRPMSRTTIEFISKANAYKVFPIRRTMLLNTSGLRYDRFDHALK